METAAFIIVGMIVWHLATLNSLALYAGVPVDSWFIAPRGVVLNKYHLIGAALAAFGTAIAVISSALDLFDYGIFAAGAFAIWDPLFMYFALRDYKKRVS